MHMYKTVPVFDWREYIGTIKGVLLQRSLNNIWKKQVGNPQTGDKKTALEHKSICSIPLSLLGNVVLHTHRRTHSLNEKIQALWEMNTWKPLICSQFDTSSGWCYQRNCSLRAQSEGPFTTAHLPVCFFKRPSNGVDIILLLDHLELLLLLLQSNGNSMPLQSPALIKVGGGVSVARRELGSGVSGWGQRGQGQEAGLKGGFQQQGLVPGSYPWSFNLIHLITSQS